MNHYFVDTNIIFSYSHKFETTHDLSNKLLSRTRVYASKISFDEVNAVRNTRDNIYSQFARVVKQAAIPERDLFKEDVLFRLVSDIIKTNRHYSHLEDVFRYILKITSSETKTKKTLVKYFRRVIRDITQNIETALDILKPPISIVGDVELETQIAKFITPETDRKIVSEAAYWFQNNISAGRNNHFVTNDAEHILSQKSNLIRIVDGYFSNNFKFRLEHIRDT
ncbi:MAG: hypothetical protein ABH829_01345 [archaeon]